MPTLAPAQAAPARTAPRPAPVLRRCACGGSAPAGGECAECRRKRLQRSPSGPSPVETAPDAVHRVLRSAGEPLDAATRAYMEPRFGHSFGSVRVHADGAAAESAASVGAKAYAVGRDVVFGSGTYSPGSADGRRLIAHELAHVVQQRGAAPSMSASLEVGPVDSPEEREADAAAERVAGGQAAAAAGGGAAPVLRRTPGVDAADSWAALAPTVVAAEERRTRALEAIRRMLATPSGAQLANSLYRTFCRAGRCRTRIRITFMDQLPPEDVRIEGKGHFEPDERGAPEYRIRLRNEVPYTGTARQMPGGVWPGGSPVDISYTHSDPESSMAETVYHELLHVWYVNTQDDSLYPTGHGSVQRGEISDVFLEHIRSFMREIDTLENDIHAQEAARRSQAEAAPAREPAAAAPPPRTEPAPREEERRPSFVGGEASVQVGGAGRPGGGAFTGIVGGDLILGNLYSLRLGVRGVYLTPDQLFTGGTVGFRVLQAGSDRPGGERVERPIFFDLEAGILAELTPNAASRFTDHFAGFASLGVGQEMGQAGPRFFWRVGGFVVVSDRVGAGSGGTGGTGTGGASSGPPVAGGGTGGVGVRW